MNYDEMEPGPEMDALLAEKVMGLIVPLVDWPCGFMPEGCRREAAAIQCTDDYTSFIEPIRPAAYCIASVFYTDPHPVYEVYCDNGSLAYYEPVKEYSKDIACAQEVFKKLRADGWAVSWDWDDTGHSIHLKRWKDGWQGVDVTCCETLALAGCRAALKAMEVS